MYTQACMIDSIKACIQATSFTFTDHALRQMLKRRISDTDVTEAVLADEIIEDYPHDKYGPSCLIYGRTKSGRPLHVQCSYPPQVRIVTTYEPDPTEWTNARVRRAQ
jgi:hypothetical protein